jgi:hypothetical protein
LLKPDLHRNPIIGAISALALGGAIGAFRIRICLLGRFIEVSINLAEPTVVERGQLRDGT